MQCSGPASPAADRQAVMRPASTPPAKLSPKRASKKKTALASELTKASKTCDLYKTRTSF
jgi:hypothetical protein